MRILSALCLALFPLAAFAQEDAVRLYAPPSLVDTGVFKHILPRFSLKTQVRVTLVDAANDADLVIGPDGRALFQDAVTTWHLEQRDTDNAKVARFAEWLRSDVGQRTLFGYAPEGAALFQPPAKTETVVVAVEISGDVGLGAEVSALKCARCHAVTEAGRKNDIGSTPSFFLLRGMGDWQERFEVFYVLKPHGAFTQIDGVTEPFPPERPSPIVPIQMTLEEVEAVLAYVESLPPADLGAPLEHQ
ncbi:cytochrome c [Cognatishimia sp. F0-27]|uniref:c-type cytochrome n=1 Tax=Cognatishimia sp. F0-27 TaxID=2816855 RepID=UPI001D0C52BB|nr:cytochrome c [Cognatishimia sp. F0-27]MCC1492930.1 cytochrome c [Cognatishimia sp. F0-27]